MKKHSVLTRFLLICLAACATPIILAILYFSKVTARQLTSAAENNVAFLMDQMAVNVSSNMNMLNNTSYYLMSNDSVQQVMEASHASALLTAQVETQVSSALTYNSAWSERLINALCLFGDSGSAYTSFRESVYAGVRSRLKAISEQYGDFSSTRELVRPDGSPYCYYVQDYYDIDVQKRLGKLVIEVNPASLLGTYLDEFAYADSLVFLTAQEGNMLYGSGEANIDTATLRECYQNCQTANAGQYYHAVKPLDRYRLVLNVFIPYAEITGAAQAAQSTFIIMEFVVLAFFIAMYMYLMARVRRIGNGWFVKLQQLAGGDFSVRFPDSKYVELNVTASACNRTAEQLGTLFHRVYETGALLNQAEYQMLESQIDPHFIMNVLETINMSCLMAGQRAISEMVVNLGMLLKSNIVMKKKQTITLQQELEYARYYLQLQKMRFRGLEFSIDVEDDRLLSYYLPKLTIQPIAENSVVHGLEDLTHTGRVDISVWEESGAICVRVRDNGKGFDTAAYEMTPEDISPELGRSHIALKNIKRRIELLYGSDYSLTVSSVLGKGTDVLLTLPLDATGDTPFSAEGHVCLK